MANTIFSVTLQNLRKEHKVTQEQLASYLGVSAQAVSKWENGSYPEGDLLPRLAEYFDVSIDTLYGKGSEKKTIEQNVLETMQSLIGTGNNRNQKVFDKMFDLIWAMMGSMWVNNRDYHDRQVEQNVSKVASAVDDNAGYAFLSLNKDLEFCTMMKQPEEGFNTMFRDSEAKRQLFEFLGEPGTLTILEYLLTLNGGDYAGAETVAQATGVDRAKVEKALDTIRDHISGGNGCFYAIQVVGKDDEGERLYGVNKAMAGLFLAILSAADMIVAPPSGFQLQMGMRDTAWTDRDHFKKNEKSLRSMKK